VDKKTDRNYLKQIKVKNTIANEEHRLGTHFPYLGIESENR